ncbi:hypothetical protein [Glycomyces tenuis]|uniref:hypothetical protein n=1 Tax=Glycomyces tenuis TaxID=58116 RepID=UPI00040ABF2C|nr:hypothetical protein [Glycomyces tenuis]
MNSRIIEVRYRTFVPVAYLVTGSLAIPVGVFAIVTQLWDLQFLFGVGVVFLVIGARMRSRPYGAYDVKAKALVVYWFSTRRVRWTFGTPNGERLVVDDGRIRRIDADGRVKTVVILWDCDPEDRARLVQVIESQERSRQAKEAKRR